MKRHKSEFNPDRHRSQTQARLVLGGGLILVLGGGGLVWLLYGPQASLVSVLCLLAFGGVLGLLWLLLTLLERWVKEDEP